VKQSFVSGLNWALPQDGDSSQFYSSAFGCALESVWTLGVVTKDVRLQTCSSRKVVLLFVRDSTLEKT
jgi:hypothetical protein